MIKTKNTTNNYEKYNAEYHKNLRMEMRVEIAFLATNGKMVSPISGEPVKICNKQFKEEDCTIYHHIIHINGKRPNGAKARLTELYHNWWNVAPITIKEHKEHHWGDNEKDYELSPIINIVGGI